MKDIKRVSYIVLSALIAVSLISCSKESKDDHSYDTSPKLINSFYTNELWNADRIEILRSDGARKRSDNVSVIIQWLYEVGKLNVTINPLPEDYSGVAYTITLFNGEEELYVFTPTNINKNVIVLSEELVDAMSTLWESDKLVIEF